jgi:hypothetical protein
MKRVAGVTEDALVLLVPVEGVEVERDVAGQVPVPHPEPRADGVADLYGLVLGRVHAERDCLRRTYAARLPEEHRARAVDDRVPAALRPHPALDRLMPEQVTGLADLVLHSRAHGG